MRYSVIYILKRNRYSQLLTYKSEWALTDYLQLLTREPEWALADYSRLLTYKSE